MSSQVWVDISIDFIEGLPKVGRKFVILTVVDHFSKYAHFIALSHPYTAVSVTRAFFDGIVWVYGFPSSIVSDKDPRVHETCVARPLQDGRHHATHDHVIPPLGRRANQGC